MSERVRGAAGPTQKMIPMRFGTVDEVAALVAFGNSEAAYITGQTIGVDGGLGSGRLLAVRMATYRALNTLRLRPHAGLFSESS